MESLSQSLFSFLSSVLVPRTGTDVTGVARLSRAYADRYSRRYLSKGVHSVVVLITGERRAPVDVFTEGVTTIYPDQKLSEADWLRRYRVSYMTGWRSQPVHIENLNIQK